MPTGRKRRRKSKASIKSESLLFYDLDVPLVLDRSDKTIHHVQTKTKTKTSSSILLGPKDDQYALIHRLIDTGYSTIALSHSIKGQFSSDRDIASKTIPYNFVLNNKNVKNKTTILKRLNVVVEDAADLGNFCSNVATDSVTEALKTYDIIAMSPQSDSSLTSICTMSNLFYCDIVTLDYTSGRGGIQLPYKLKPSDIKAATNRGLVFELPYGPAITDPSKRKAFVQTARIFLNAIVGIKDDITRNPPKIIISSGKRVFENHDHSVMALRSPNDMVNFANIVLGFHQKLSKDAFSQNAFWAVERGQNRKCEKVASSSLVSFGKGRCVPLTFEVIDNLPDDNVNLVEIKPGKDEEKANKEEYKGNSDSEDEESQSYDEKLDFDHDVDFLKLS